MKAGELATTCFNRIVSRRFTMRVALSGLWVLLYLSSSAYTWAKAPNILPDEVYPSGTFCDGVTEIPLVECEALEAFYNSTNGPDWAHDSGWLFTNTPCSWYGVSCVGGHVTSVSLSGNEVSGQLPEELGNLSELEVLNLSENFNISGPIPPTLGNLSQLRLLDLFKNKLSDPIPGELGNLTELTHLYLSTNRLTGPIPDELGNLSNLIVLDLSGNKLYDPIPPTLGNLNNLTLLHFSYNNLTGRIPSTFGQLANLEYLIIVNNQLSGSIPAELGDLNNLIGLSLEQNQLSGPIPPELSRLSKASIINLGWNLLSGSIPAELGNLNNLSRLVLLRNHLSGSLPPELGNLSSLYDLGLNANHLSGPIPTSLTQLTNLQNIGLGHNALYTSDPIVAAFISSKNPGWEETQTLAPGNFQGRASSTNQVELAWDPILYIRDFGHYEVTYATHPAGPYSLAGTTTDKTATGIKVRGLAAGQTYYFRVRTFSTVEWMDWSHVWSEYSSLLSITMPLAFEEITPQAGAETSFGLPGGLTVGLQIPAGAVTETMILQALPNSGSNSPSRLLQVGGSFDLAAQRDGIPYEGFTFARPVLMRIDYTDELTELVDESSLKLYVWGDGAWVDAAGSCDPSSTYTRNLDENWFSVGICHLSQFAIFGKAPGSTLYFPAVGLP